MSTVAQPAVVHRVAAVTAERMRRRWAAAWLFLAAVVAALAFVAWMPSDSKPIAAPIAALGVITAAFTTILWSRDGALPLFEAGFLCMLTNALYGIMGLASFATMHGWWNPYADGRLLQYPFDPAEIGAFGWGYVVYAGSFAAVYLLVRRRAAVRGTPFHVPKQSLQLAILIIFAALYACKLVLKFRYGFDPENASYEDLIGSLASLESTPLLVRQLGHNVLSALQLVSLGVLVLLLARWRRQRWARVVVVVWLASVAVSTAVELGSRSTAMILVLSAGLLYHRLVKPIGFRAAIIGGVLLLSAFTIVGTVRQGFRGAEAGRQALTAGSEFQALFTTAFDIHKRHEAGQIGHVPWQLYASDFTLLVPRQLLPFEKIDPSQWYIDLIGMTGYGVGFMFGVMSQAALGLGWIELVLRGAALAVCLALLHRWYVRRCAGFWPTLFYLFVGVWIYIAFRASTFYFLYFVFYNFLPVMLVTKLVEIVVTRVHRGIRTPERKLA